MAPVWFRTLRFTVLLPGTVTVVVPGIIVALTFAPDTWPAGWRWAGLGLVIPGAALYAWTAWCFAVRGLGTPAPWDAPKRLVVGGPYAISRNPMYVAVVSVVAGEAILAGSHWIGLWAAAVVAAFVQRVLWYEEPRLEAQFGDEYRAYSRRVGRWIGVRSVRRD